MSALRICALLLMLCPALRGQAPGSDEASQLREVRRLSADLENPQQLNQALHLCRKILKRNPACFEALTAGTRLCWHIGVQLDDEDKARQTFEIGYELAEKLKQKFPGKADGYYWYAVNFGQHLDRSSIFAKIAGHGRIKEHAKKALQLEPEYDSGGAYLIIGRINQMMPGGDEQAARDCFLKAIAINPRRSTGHLYMAEWLLDHEDPAQAAAEARKVLDGPHDPLYPVEQKLNAPKAREILERIGGPGN